MILHDRTIFKETNRLLPLNIEQKRNILPQIYILRKIAQKLNYRVKYLKSCFLFRFKISCLTFLLNF